MDLTKISFTIPYDLIQALKVIPIQVLGNRNDSRIWVYSSHGDFFLKSAYLLACLEGDGSNSIPFEGCWVWKAQIPPHIKAFSLVVLA